MKSKNFKIVIFSIYTLFIYFLPVLIGSITTLLKYNLATTIESLMFSGYILIFPFLMLPLYIRRIDLINNSGGFILSLIFIILAIAIYAMPFVVWWYRQTLMKAFLISLMGAFLGPGLPYIHDEKSLTATLGIINTLLLTGFYLTFYFGDKLQKKNWPDNKLANKIRFLLTWPCLRT